MAKQYIKIRGANEHNLKNISLDIPRNELVVLTGLSGSGKSSLAFDTIYAEGQRRYMESLSSYARQFLGQMEKPDVESIEGLSPAISIDQKSTNRNPRSTVGTVTEIYDYMRLLYARIGIPHCPKCGREIKKQTIDQMVDQILQLPERTGLPESLRQRPFIFFHHDTPLHSDIPYYAPVQACLNERSAYGSEAARYRRDEKRTPLRQPPLGGAAGRDGPEAPLLRLRTRGHGPPPKAGEKYQTHDYRGGIDMRPKWTRYLAMGVALLLAVLMLATLIVPYLSL